MELLFPLLAYLSAATPKIILGAAGGFIEGAEPVILPALLGPFLGGGLGGQRLSRCCLVLE